MKLVKIGIVAVVVILVLNFMGLLNPLFSKKVDDVSNSALKTAKEQWNNLPIAKEASADLITSVATLASPVDFENKGNGVYSIKGNTLTGTLDNNTPKSLQLSFDPTDVKTVHQAEGVLSLFAGKKVELPIDSLKGLATVNIKVSYQNNGFVVNSNINGFNITK